MSRRSLAASEPPDRFLFQCIRTGDQRKGMLFDYVDLSADQFFNVAQVGFFLAVVKCNSYSRVSRPAGSGLRATLTITAGQNMRDGDL